MATSSILGGNPAPAEHAGADIDALGPSDSSDTGSDVQTDRHRSALPEEAAEGAWPVEHGSTTDSSGTGERASADPAPPQADSDILPDRVGQFPPGTAGAAQDAQDATPEALIDAEEDDERDGEEGEEP